MSDRSRRSALPFLVVVLVVAAGASWWLSQRRPPAPVDAPPAASAPAPAPDADDADAADAATAAATDVTLATLAGTWVVDPSVDPDPAAGVGSFVGYLVDEELSTIGAFTANGRTSAVDGTVVIDGTTVTAADFRAPLDGLTSDSSLRDGRVRSLLGGVVAEFTLAGPFDVAAVPAAGDAAMLSVPGRLTVGDVTSDVTAELSVSVEGANLVVVGTIPVALSALGVEAPSAPIVLSVSDAATIEVRLVLARA